MKKSTIIILLVCASTVLFAQEKKDTTFVDQYQKMKSSYMEEIKRDSFYVSTPVLSKKFYAGEIEVSKGITKKHYSVIITDVVGEWRYPAFNNEQFENWMKQQKSKK